MTSRRGWTAALSVTALLALAPDAWGQATSEWQRFSTTFTADCDLADPAGADCAVRYARGGTRPFTGAGRVASARDLLGDQVVQLDAGRAWLRGTTALGFAGSAFVGTTGPVRAWGATWAATGTASGGAPGKRGGPLRLTREGARWTVAGYLRCLPVTCRIPAR